MRNFSMKKLGTPIAGGPGTDSAKPGLDGAETGPGVAPCCSCCCSSLVSWSSFFLFFLGSALGLRGAALVGRGPGGLTMVGSGGGGTAVVCCSGTGTVIWFVAVVDCGAPVLDSDVMASGQILGSGFGHRSMPEAGDREEPRPTESAPVITRLVISFRVFIPAACLLPPWAPRAAPLSPDPCPSRDSGGSTLLGERDVFNAEPYLEHSCHAAARGTAGPSSRVRRPDPAAGPCRDIETRRRGEVALPRAF